MSVHVAAKCNEGAAEWPPIHTQAPIISLNFSLVWEYSWPYNAKHKCFLKGRFIQSAKYTRLWGCHIKKQLTVISPESDWCHLSWKNPPIRFMNTFRGQDETILWEILELSRCIFVALHLDSSLWRHSKGWNFIFSLWSISNIAKICYVFTVSANVLFYL